MLTLQIALRYIISMRKASTVHLLSWISFLGVALGTMAMVVVLSAFNGFEKLLTEIYHRQDPDLLVSSTQGKSFTLANEQLSRIKALPGCKSAFQVLRDKIAIEYGDGQMVAEVLGVENGYENISRLDTLVKHGSFELFHPTEARILLSIGIQQALNIQLSNNFDFVKLSYPRKKKLLKLGTSKIFNTQALRPIGIVQLDENRVYIPLALARSLMEKPEGANQLDIFVQNPSQLTEVKAGILKILGSEFTVKDELEQHADLYKILKIEKLFVFLALGFIILISTFNLFVCASMLVIDKSKDLKTLVALGMPPNGLQQIIKWAGATIALSGLALGLMVGFIICLIQRHYGIVPLGMSTTTVTAYPIDPQLVDFVLVSVWVTSISILALYKPAAQAARIGQHFHLV